MNYLLQSCFSQPLKLIAAGVLAATFTAANASTLATDNAANAAYTSGWANGSNGGSGFGAWALTNDGASSGSFIGDSTTLNAANTGANINTSGKSFGMFGHTGQTSNAIRPFIGDLSVGQTFSIDIAVNFRNGNKGFDLRNSSAAAIFTFSITGNDYVVSNATTGNGSIGSAFSTNTKFTISLAQTSAGAGTWTITRSGGVSDLDTGTYTGAGASIKLFESQTTGSGAAEDNLFANNLSIVPEPSTVALLALSSLGMIQMLRRRA